MRPAAPPEATSDSPGRVGDGVGSLSYAECLGLLGSTDIGRIAFVAGGGVEILPVNYGMEGSIIVFRTSPGTRLAEAAGTDVALEADGAEHASGSAWSVVVRGRAEEVTANPGRAAEHLRWVPVHPAVPGERRQWIAIKPVHVTGRRFHLPPPLRERT